MAYVNYVRENIAFIEYASDENVTANERLLWYALFHIMNKRAVGSDWPDDLISISNSRLLSLVPFSEDSLAKARNRLVQRGLIRYEPGKKNAASPRYAINYFYPELSTCYERNVESYPQNTGNMHGNMHGNNGGNVQGNMGGNNRGNVQGNNRGNMGGIIYKPNGKDNRNPIVTPNVYEEDDDDEEEQRRAREEANARMLVNTAFLRSFGREATPAEARRLCVLASLCPKQAVLMPRAIQAAAQHGAGSPAPYAARVFGEYAQYKLQTEAEVDEYELLTVYARAGETERWQQMHEAICRRAEERRTEEFGAEYGDQDDEGQLKP